MHNWQSKPSGSENPNSSAQSSTFSKTTQPWESDTKGFEFLKTEIECKPYDLGIKDISQTCVSTSAQALVFWTEPGAIIYDTKDNAVKELRHTTGNNGWLPVAYLLSPDRKLLMRWLQPTVKPDAPCTIDVILTENSHQVLASITDGCTYNLRDVYSTMWFNNSVAYIPDSARQIIIKWSLGPYAPSISIIRPLFALSRYRDLVFHISDDGAWWAIGARTEDGSGVAEGTLQVHSEKSNKDRILKGLTCCLATVDVYDKQKVLLLRAGSDNDKLWLKVEQLETVAHEQRFQPVEVSIEMLTLKDFPRTIRVLDGLPIIAINTNKRDLYFFELHTGAHLFSRSYHKGFFIWKRSDEGRSILMEADNGKQIVRVSVNELDLIGYVRQVLCDETLASSIAIRARLPGAEDVLFNDMHR